MASSRQRASAPRVILLVLALAGCGGVRGRAPVDTVDHFVASLRAQEYEAAYALMSEDYRAEVPLEAFVGNVRDNPAEIDALAARVTHAEPAEITADLDVGEEESLRLVLEEGEWKIVGDVVDFYDQSTPRAALRSFVRAMERRRYDVVMRFVPRADREGMSEERMRAAWEGEGREEIERLLQSLRASLENPIEEVGDRATMAYGQRHTVQFVREDGVWRIEDPD